MARTPKGQKQQCIATVARDIVKEGVGEARKCLTRKWGISSMSPPRAPSS